MRIYANLSRPFNNAERRQLSQGESKPVFHQVMIPLDTIDTPLGRDHAKTIRHQAIESMQRLHEFDAYAQVVLVFPDGYRPHLIEMITDKIGLRQQCQIQFRSQVVSWASSQTDAVS